MKLRTAKDILASICILMIILIFIGSSTQNRFIALCGIIVAFSGAIFWIVFGAIFLLMSFMFNNYSLSWVGLGGLLSGIFVIKISVDFFFYYFIRFIYN